MEGRKIPKSMGGFEWGGPCCAVRASKSECCLESGRLEIENPPPATSCFFQSRLHKAEKRPNLDQRNVPRIGFLVSHALATSGTHVTYYYISAEMELRGRS